jgi:hypothetical protein
MVWDDVRVLVSESVYQNLRVKNPCIVVEIHENAKEKRVGDRRNKGDRL